MTNLETEEGLADQFGKLRGIFDEQAGAVKGQAEIFDAVVRALQLITEPAEIDYRLQEEIARRLARGEQEKDVLLGAKRAGDAMAALVQRNISEVADQQLVVTVMSDVICDVSRMIAMASVSRSRRERAATAREEMAEKRLKDAAKQQEKRADTIERARRPTETPQF